MQKEMQDEFVSCATCPNCGGGARGGEWGCEYCRPSFYTSLPYDSLDNPKGVGLSNQEQLDVPIAGYNNPEQWH